jgi:hypothetical protein
MAKMMMALRRMLLPLVILGVWLGICYGVRFALMENPHWVAVCDGKTANLMCDARATLGLAIHFRILAYCALLFALPAFFMRGDNGKKFAWISLIFAAPALALYTVTLGIYAALIAGLRLVRDERHNAAASNAEAAAHPNA